MKSGFFRSLLPGLLLGYAALVFTGALGGGEWAYHLAVPVLVLVLAAVLPLRRAPVLALWLLLAAVMLWLDARGHAHWVLNLVPMLITAGLAWLFARTLRAGREPLVRRVVRAVEGEERLQDARVLRYTRQVTWYWAILMALQCLLLAACWALLIADGPMQAWARGWLHVGGYTLPVLAMAAEYAVRRWRFRDLPHPRPHEFIHRLVRNWPRIVRDARDTVHS
ncbi:xanthomonadin biosynthesis protein [Oleiagrimonas sp. MCCC 1A03011]|uniref:xanthomonadin biosynthesis protein n=1 Tax=Oleiagrimonas sp. MCCC 1A03011 TaxID=1926883 RepID=UPI000DC33DB9|nr:xanthomonadin biosynthesis protein [Oleiagrimonas sp. MCCC 1A03011]RAP56910.1 hypothetical protein BTJ49_12255 [Oleiagrimonas sp. MCCC 1A03011]